MANIVEKQGVHIDEIVTSTEKSHEKAQQGLEQIKQASQHQAACIIS
jgi:phosphohistidine phosphatase SixA